MVSVVLRPSNKSARISIQARSRPQSVPTLQMHFWVHIMCFRSRLSFLVISKSAVSALESHAICINELFLRTKVLYMCQTLSRLIQNVGQRNTHVRGFLKKLLCTRNTHIQCRICGMCKRNQGTAASTLGRKKGSPRIFETFLGTLDGGECARMFNIHEMSRNVQIMSPIL